MYPLFKIWCSFLNIQNYDKCSTYLESYTHAQELFCVKYVLLSGMCFLDGPELVVLHLKPHVFDDFFTWLRICESRKLAARKPLSNKYPPSQPLWFLYCHLFEMHMTYVISLILRTGINFDKYSVQVLCDINNVRHNQLHVQIGWKKCFVNLTAVERGAKDTKGTVKLIDRKLTPWLKKKIDKQESSTVFHCRIVFLIINIYLGFFS